MCEYFASATKQTFEKAGFQFDSFTSLDSRNEDKAAELVGDSNLIILSGGHVPTQNRFFNKIGLRGLLKNYNGIVIGISAGNMNSADVVYTHVEREGEAIDPEYQRFLTGLNLTKIMLLPHYQDIKDDVLDGLRVFEDVAYPDSVGRTFYAIPDGSYLFIDSGREELRGEAYIINDGALRQISIDGEFVTV